MKKERILTLINLKVARTMVDLENTLVVIGNHKAEAIQYRSPIGIIPEP